MSSGGHSADPRLLRPNFGGVVKIAGSMPRNLSALKARCYDTLNKAIALAVEQVSWWDAHSWFEHGGFLGQCS
jgi:hypothetical protein